MEQWIYNAPVWAVLAATIGLVLSAIWVGNLAGRHFSKKAADDAPTTAVTGAHLGLLAFFVAFSFNMASGHFDERRKLVLEEVNAINTLYNATHLMRDQVSGSAIREQLRDYVDIRANLTPGTELARAISDSEAIHYRIQSILVDMSSSQGLQPADSAVAKSMETVVSYHHRRVAAAFHYRIPTSIWPALYAILTFSMIGLGYTFGLKGSRNHLGSLALALSFSMVIFLIADLDRPTSGLMIADQSAMQQLAARIGKQDPP